MFRYWISARQCATFESRISGLLPDLAKQRSAATTFLLTSSAKGESKMSIANQTSAAGIVPNRPTPTFGNPDLPPQGRVNTAGNLESLRSDAPHNEVIESQFPSQMDPPATDISTQPFFWSSFNISPKRIQNGGWARELTSQDFASDDPVGGAHPVAPITRSPELHLQQKEESTPATVDVVRRGALSTAPSRARGVRDWVNARAVQ
jgi:hypothetical protein